MKLGKYFQESAKRISFFY